MRRIISFCARYCHFATATLAFVGIAACSDGKVSPLVEKPNAETNSFSISAQDPKPAPGTEDSVESQLKRYKGQTKFLTANGGSGGYGGLQGGIIPSGNKSAEVGGAPGQRAIQESDVFKLGTPGSKLLYLLNNYRGLQVVSFANNPGGELVGRLESTGNMPQDLFFDAAKSRLVALENIQIDESGNYDFSRQQSRLVSYDVSVPNAPKISGVLPLEGAISEHRMVGDILYVATSVRHWGNSAEKVGEGYVYSFDMSTAPLTQVQRKELSAPFTWGGVMNALQVEEGGVRKYYLAAVLNTGTGGFQNQQNGVELIDISDPKGAIRSVMLVNVKGSIRKPSQVMVKNGALVVVSNYLPGSSAAAIPAVSPAPAQPGGGLTPGVRPFPVQPANNGARMRIAVESFALPPANPEILSEDEVAFRKLNLARSLEKKRSELRAGGTDQDALDLAMEVAKVVLEKDPELGLKGRFQQKGNTLHKILSDGFESTGSTQNLSAILKDVRVDGNNLYAFWVPSNDIDPLDIFDISNPTKEVTLKSRLPDLEGWTEHSIPMTFQGQRYIVSLGWVIPAVKNEKNRRFPQASLFKIVNFGESNVKAEPVDSKIIGNSSLWIDLGAKDKYFDVRMTAEGKGTIMFSVIDQVSGKYTQGAKFVSFDLGQAQAAPKQVFQEGAFLKADAGWLRRVFHNDEVDSVQAFSDESLATFPKAASEAGANVVAAAHVLELARNVRGYTTVKTPEGVFGIQFVKRSADIAMDYGAQTTELRLVKAAFADSELSEIIGKLSLAGEFVKAVPLKENNLAVLTKQYSSASIRGDFGETISNYKLTVVRVAAGRIVQIGETAQWSVGRKQMETVSPLLGSYSWQESILRTNDGGVYLLAGGIRSITLKGDTVAVQELTSAACGVAQANQFANILVLNGQLYRQRSESIPDPTRRGLFYARTLLSSVTQKETVLTCGAEVNIPGNALALFEGGKLITSDSRFLDSVPQGEGQNVYHLAITQPVLTVVQLGAQATLADSVEAKDVAGANFKLLGKDKLVGITSEADTYSGTFGSFESTGGRSTSLESDANFGQRIRGRPQRGKTRLVTLSLGNDSTILSTVHALGLPANSYASLAQVSSTANSPAALLTVAMGRNLALLSYDGVNRPVVKKLRLVGRAGALGEAAAFAVVPSWEWGWRVDESVDVNFASQEVAVSCTLNGLRQWKIVD